VGEGTKSITWARSGFLMACSLYCSMDVRPASRPRNKEYISARLGFLWLVVDTAYRRYSTWTVRLTGSRTLEGSFSMREDIRTWLADMNKEPLCAY
jgi:hypothetical protein